MNRNIAGSWTLDLIRSNIAIMKISSVFKYRSMILAELNSDFDGTKIVSLDLKRPFPGQIRLRSGSSDYHTLREVVFKQVYNDACEKATACRTVVDIGANIGLASRYFAARLPGCQVFSVEPCLDNFRMLEWNTSDLVGLGRCRIARRAVWGYPTDLAVSEPPGGYSFDCVVVGGSGNDRVQAITMGEIIDMSSFDRVGLLKIDVEGAEAEIFKSDLGWLSRVDVMAIEFHGDTRESCSFDWLAREHGFRVEGDDHTVVAHRERDPDIA